MSMLDDLKKIQRELEKNGNKYSVDQQALMRLAAQGIKATVESNMICKKYSYNEDD
jgi:hypothetical protein